jgi:hypothetical protein
VRNNIKIIISLFITIASIIFNIEKCFGQGSISVRKAFESKTPDDDKAATISFTSPKKKSSSFLLNAGIGYTFSEKPFGKTKDKNKLTFNSFFVYNINNLISKEQHNYKVGITAETRFGMNPQNLVIFGNHTIEYIRDYIDTNYSALVTTYWHLFLKKKGLPKFGGYSSPDKSFSYFFESKIGLEYQYLIDAKNKLLNAEGFDFRGFQSIGGNLLFRTGNESDEKPDSRTKLLELVVSYDFRESLISNVKSNKENSCLFKVGINFYPTRDGNLSVGGSYNHGEDPIAGILKQEYWVVALQFKLH